MVDFYWEKSTADAVLRFLSMLLMVEGVFLWIFSYSDAIVIFTGFVVFLTGDLGFLLGKTPFWNNLFDRDFRRVLKIQREAKKETGVVVVEARLKPERKTAKKPSKKRKKARKKGKK